MASTSGTVRETMNTVLWIVQIILAVAFGVAGVLKSTRGRALEGTMPWVEDFSDRTVRFIGVMELLGAIGLVLPAATGIAAWLTPLAATAETLNRASPLLPTTSGAGPSATSKSWSPAL